jgi:hypothetical protein
VTSDAYFGQLVVYIHQNPQEPGLIDDFRDWSYSSYGAMLSKQPTRLQRETVLDWFQGLVYFEQRHQQGLNQAQLEPLILEDFD